MLIGLTTSINKSGNAERTNRAYIDYIQSVGGIPILLPPLVKEEDIEELFGHLKGIVLTGGGDIEPGLYGDAQVIEQTKDISTKRDHFEMELVRKAHERNFPFFGICRGIQVMNVALGGSLYQDACFYGLTDKNHFQESPFERETHGLHIVEGTRLAAIYSEEEGDVVELPESSAPGQPADSKLERAIDPALGQSADPRLERAVNSIHHQCIKKVAPELQINAWSDDGLIEGIEDPSKCFFIGVQWHPEYLKADDPLFRAFCECARQQG